MQARRSGTRRVEVIGWLPNGAVQGSVVSLEGLIMDSLVDGLVGDQFLEPGVLALQILQLLGPGCLHAAVFLAPTITALLQEARGLLDLAEGTATGQPDLGFAQHVDALFGFYPFLAMIG